MSIASPYEQLMLEMLNRARMDPLAEAARQGLAPGAVTSVPVQVVPLHDALVTASRNHSNYMLLNDVWTAEEIAGNPGYTGWLRGHRAFAAGYPTSPQGYFIHGNASHIPAVDTPPSLAAAVELQFKTMFAASGTQFLDARWHEIGIGSAFGDFSGTSTSFSEIALFDDHGSDPGDYIVGVVYNDANGNEFFNAGEQLAGQDVTATGNVSDTTGPGGGYGLRFTSTGVKTVDIESAGQLFSMNVTLGAENIKIDLIDRGAVHEFWTNASAVLQTPNVAEIHALGIGAISLTGTFANEQLFGNVAANTLTGGFGNDTLDGRGGPDTLKGGGGNDVYVVDNAADIVSEVAGNGTDTVLSSISFSLANASRVIGDLEKLTLLNVAAATSATGNALNNVLTGNGFNNVLNGGPGSDTLTGGPGKDTLIGGLGNDFYVLENGADGVSDSGGVDSATSTVSRSLAAGGLTAVENLTLANVASALSGTGNNLNNVITGNNFNNTLSGGIGNDILKGGLGADTIIGAAGNDTLVGGPGNDFFVFNSAPNAATNRDNVADFHNLAGDNDTVRMENAVFAKLGAAGALNPLFFKAAPAATDGNDYIVYNRATGALFYDVNGNAAGGAIQFATIASRVALTASDFVVI